MTLIPQWKLAIETKLSELLPEQATALHHPLFEAARYSLLASGKRLRPLLAIATATSYGCELAQVLTPACALEIVHTYSLIHDDLPCMDDDDMRRGKPTLHKVYPEGHAVLTGDFLLTYAFELLGSSPALSAQQKVELIVMLSRAVGADGMIGGQVLDLCSEGKTLDWEALQWMHLNKTAALLTASLQVGAIVANAPANDRLLLSDVGHKLGLAFQIIDDILDVNSENSSSDAQKQKATAVSLLGIEGARKWADSLFKTATETLNRLSVPAPLLHQLAEHLTTRTS